MSYLVLVFAKALSRFAHISAGPIGRWRSDSIGRLTMGASTSDSIRFAFEVSSVV